MRDIPNLDFLRAIAVLTVVVEHTMLALGVQWVGPFEVQYFGVLGVLVFFVLTSLVLMWSLERRPHTLDFYIRRWFRIYPLAIVIIILAIATKAPITGTPDAFFGVLHVSMRDLAIQLALLHQVIPAHAIMPPMWSLTYEVLMYLLLPALFFFVQKNFSLWPLVLLWMLVLVTNYRGPSDHHSFGTSIAYFLPGIMAYVGFGRWKARIPVWVLPLFLVAVWAAFLYHFNFHRGWWFCLVVGLALPFFRQFKSALVLEPSRIIAKYSYGIYLTHLFAIVIGIYLLRGSPIWVRFIAEGACVVAFAWLAYHLIEHPLIRIGSRIAAKVEKRYEQHELKTYRAVVGEN